MKNMDTIFFETIDEVPVSPWHVVVASIEDTIVYFKDLGLPSLLALNVPSELMKFAGRKIEYMTMGEFRKDTREPIFVKPNGQAKAFVAGVLRKSSSKSFLFPDVPDSESVLVSEVVDFVSEYRGYVIRGDLKGIKHYLGDIRVFPDMDVVDEAIRAYTSDPAGYSIDFGVTSEGKTLLIECNDGWSLGNYGLDHQVYANLLMARWDELMQARAQLIRNENN